MSTQGSTAKYIELSNQTYGLIVDTLGSATRSRLNYWKSIWEIASRPYASTAIESVVRENFDRASELANLTFGELRSRGQRTADFSEKFLAQVEKLQDAATETYRDSLKSYVSTVDQVKNAAAEVSPNGVKHQKTPANLAPVSN
ncbi:MAG: hypothetical protein ACLPSH_19295 [Vulcanimicrobiaceae bacterium]